jgi:hypothetical protein
VTKLEELSGVTGETIRKHLPEWEKEAEEILVASSEFSLGLRLSAEKLHLHESDMIHLRDQIQQVKFELEKMDQITARLADWLDKFDEEQRQEALTIFDAWQRACGQKASLRSQFLALQKQWTSLEGIVDLKDISVVREKEIAKGKAKLEIKQLENEKPSAPRPVGGGVFSRPEKLLDSQE